MTFIEKNKAWLLPLLGLGVAGVLYLDFHSKAAPVPEPPVAPAPSAQAPAPGAQAPAPGTQIPAPAAAAAPPVAGAPGDLWGDLQALEKPPEALCQEDALKKRCRASLGPLLEAPAWSRLPRPGWVREAEPPKAAPSGPPLPPPPPAPVPVVDFVLSGAQGATAWIHGRPYRAGENIPGGPFSVASIEWNRVGLTGPKGDTTFQFTNRLTHPPAGPRPSSEAP